MRFHRNVNGDTYWHQIRQRLRQQAAERDKRHECRPMRSITRLSAITAYEIVPDKPPYMLASISNW